MEEISVTEGVKADDVVVTVGSGPDATTHRVTVPADVLASLGRPGEDRSAFVRRCFEFLLEREPKESILAAFDVAVIGRYFPEFPDEIQA